MDKVKKKPLLKAGQIVFIAVAVIVSAALIVADYYANKHSSIISTFLGCGVQLEGDTTKVEEGAKSGDEVVRKIADEGVVLLKNEKDGKGDAALPLGKNEKKVNIFGWCATDAGFLLTGNGSGKSYIHPDNKVTLLQAFKDSGFDYNEEIIGIYENHRKDEDGDWGESGNWGERRSTTLKEPVTDKAFPAEVITRAQAFSDVAIIVISRYSGEFLGRLSSTQPKYNLPEDKTRCFNEISTEEETLIKMCTRSFGKVIVIFNTGSIFDMTFIDDTENFGKIDAALNVGYMGQSGATAIPKILSGEVNPSGKLADTVVYDPKVNEVAYLPVLFHDTVYTEDIYMGYKFYETADAEGYYNGRTKFGKSGYDAVVQYPFGHGLSYTTFSWEIESVSLPDGSALEKDSEIELKVRVTNTGKVNGKDAVGLYYTAQYYKGGIEKAAVNLLDFAKTPELEPEQSALVTFNFTPYEMASYDCYDKNETGTTGWELDIGKYEVKLMTDSHHLKEMTKNTLTYKVEDFELRYLKDPVSGGRIKNRFTGDTAYGDCPLDGSNLETNWKYLSRSNFAGTYNRSDGSSPASRIISQYSTYYYDDYDYTQLPAMSSGGDLRLVTKSDGSYVSKEEFDGTKTGDFTLEYNDDLIFELGNADNWNSPVWEQLLDQLTADDLRALVEDGGYGTRSVASIGKPQWIDYDGPSGFNNTNLSPNVKGAKLTALPAENLVAQTWNKQLVYQAGQIIGIDAQNFGLSGIYAPGINLHRDSLNGRNYEYYSEDPILSGYLAASFVRGAKSNGVYCFVKHLALFDASSLGYQRVWCTEQNLRENYLKPFELAIKKGGASGVMVSFNNMGATWSGSNQALLDGCLRTEFGFKGSIVTDFDSGNEACWKIRHGIRAGVNTQLNPSYGKADQWGRIDLSDATDMHRARFSAKSIIYAQCNAYYYAKTNTEKNEYSAEIMGPRAVKMGFAWWIPVVVAINVVVFGVLIWRGLAAFLPKRKAAAVVGGEVEVGSSAGGDTEKKGGFFSRFGKKKREEDTFEVVGGENRVNLVFRQSERIQTLEAENAELKRTVAELREKLAAIETTKKSTAEKK